jgi:hypothetical protein
MYGFELEPVSESDMLRTARGGVVLGAPAAQLLRRFLISFRWSVSFHFSVTRLHTLRTLRSEYPDLSNWYSTDQSTRHADIGARQRPSISDSEVLF